MRYGPFFKPKTVQVYSTLKICTMNFFLNELPYITKTPAHTSTPWGYVLFVHSAQNRAISFKYHTSGTGNYTISAKITIFDKANICGLFLGTRCCALNLQRGDTARSETFQEH